MADKPLLMKDGLGSAAVARLASALSAASGSFDAEAFTRLATRGLNGLELKARVGHLIEALGRTLPAEYPLALPVVLAAAEAMPAAAPGDKLSGFAYWPLVDWVAVHGLPHFDLSLQALRRLTPRFSAEFAVRPFLLANPDRALATLAGWLADPDPHVRRLVSEGTRPRLPWGCQLPVFREDPSPLLPLLAALRDDESDYVRRSVANNLNDIAKDHPSVVVDTAGQWWRDAPAERQALVRHALRTLVKQGDPGAMAVLGFATEPKVASTLTLSSAAVTIGERLSLSLSMVSLARHSQSLVIDYVVHHRRAQGKMSAKVFKWRTVELPAGATVELTRTHAFVPRSVRRLYPGRHRIEILVCGRVVADGDLELLTP